MNTALRLLMMGFCVATCAGATGGAPVQDAPATQPATRAADLTGSAGVDELRARLQEAYGRGDVDELLQYLHPEVVIVFPDGEVLRGRDALVAYMDRMLSGPDAIVESYTTAPVVEERFIHGDTVVSHGRMNDHYVLTDGTEFGLDSRFTVTAIRHAEGPAATGGWVVRSFHSSTDAFDNPILSIAARRVLWYAGLGGVLLGLLIGAVGVWLLARRWAAPPSASAAAASS